MNSLFKICRFLWITLCLTMLSSTVYMQEDEISGLLEQATEFVQQSQYDKALDIYNFYLRFLPNHVDALSQRAVTYASIGDFDRAFRDIDHAFDSAGFSAIEQAIAHNHRAQIYFLNQETGSALKDFNRAIELNPDNPDYWLNRGILYQLTNEWELSIRDFEAYLERNPTDAEGFVNIARAYLALNNFDDAVDALGSAIAITPNDPELYIFRGSVNLIAEQFANAAQDYADWLNLINTTVYDEDAVTTDTDERTITMTYGALYRIPFTANSGDRFGVSANSVGVDSLVVLLDPDGNPIMANDDGGQGLNSFIIDFTLPTDGTYTLLVGHARGGWNGDVELTIQVVPSEGI